MHRPLGSSFAAPKCKIFVWLALRYRLWTSGRRQRHGIQFHTATCFTCLREEDTVDHVLMQCPYYHHIWFECLMVAGPNILEPGNDSSLET
jgi:hypothetical protein